jgi:hypothetical protein
VRRGRGRGCEGELGGRPTFLPRTSTISSHTSPVLLLESTSVTRDRYLEGVTDVVASVQMVKTQSSLYKYFRRLPSPDHSLPPAGLPSTSADGAEAVAETDQDMPNDQNAVSRYTPSLPTELWTHISRMSSNLRQLAATSKYFRDVSPLHLTRLRSICTGHCWRWILAPDSLRRLVSAAGPRSHTDILGMC